MKRPTTLALAEAQIDGSFVTAATARRALEVLEQALEAKVWVRSSELGPGGQRTYVEVADHPIRVTAAVRLLEMKHGKPATTLTVNQPPSGVGQGPQPRNLARLVAEHPDVIKKILDLAIEQARRLTPIAVDVSPTSPVE